MWRLSAALVFGSVCLFWSAYVSAQASGNTFYLCDKATHDPKFVYYISDVFEAGKDMRQAAQEQFLKHIVARHGAENVLNGPYGIGCRDFATKAVTEGYRSDQIVRFKSYEVVEAKWPTGPITKSSTVPHSPPAAGVLIVEDNGISARTAAWENVQLQAKRETAALQVKQAIGTAQSKVEYERILAKAKADAKKRGRAQ